jgi:hypothetical protein
VPGLGRWQLYTYQFARVDRSSQFNTIGGVGR